MAQNVVYVGDIGTKIVVNVGVSADDIIQSKMVVQKPYGEVVEWTASPVAGTQTIEYVVQEGDFDLEGEYQLQAYVETNSWKGYGSLTSFEVESHL